MQYKLYTKNCHIIQFKNKSHYFQFLHSVENSFVPVALGFSLYLFLSFSSSYLSLYPLPLFLHKHGTADA